MTSLASQRPREVQSTLNILRQEMAAFGYQPVDVPIIQPADLFLTRAGDQILHRLFTFERHGVSLSLRPEFTSPALRRYIHEYAGDRPAVVRWQVAGIIFEDDPAQDGLSYERVSSGAECIGAAGVGAEAEIIAMAASGCMAVGQPVAKVVLGDAQLIRNLLLSFALDARTERFVLSQLSALSDTSRGIEYVMDRFDAQLSTAGDIPALDVTDNPEQVIRTMLESNERGRAMGGRTQAEIARRLVQRHQRRSQRARLLEALQVLKQIAQIAGSPETVFTRLGRILEPEQWSASHDHWRRLLELLAAYGLHDEQFELVPVLARDWEYYSGLMFELYTADERHIAGGGRYDGFAQLIGSPVDIPAVGFTYYLDALLEGGTATPASSNSWSIVGEPADLSVVRWSQALRKHGFNIRVASDLPDEPLRQLIHADDQAILYDGVRYPFQDLPSLIEKLKDFTST